MSKLDFTKIIYDDSHIDVSKEVALVWSIANTLRGAYQSDKYKDVIIPMVIIRRLECALEKTKDVVVKAYDTNNDVASAVLERKSSFKFYNTSKFTLKKLLNESENIASNLVSYIEGFSPNIQDIIASLEFQKEIDKMNKNNRLYGVVKKFSELDLNPETIDGMKMGYIFEDIIRRFSENAEAGDHYTPREVIRLLVNVLLAEGCEDLINDSKIATVLDMACGTGGMLSTSFDFLKKFNPNIDVRLFGQEINDASYAICLADMLIKGQNADNIKGGDSADTLKQDCFRNQDMRFVICNPPFGTSWGGKDAAEGVEASVRYEHSSGGRFNAGLPSTGDMQLLFMQHAIAKMNVQDGRAAIITNGSPLFSGSTNSGESQIRRMMLENDLIEAIIALPTDLFYNTNIGIYVFILSKNKRPKRKGKIQLINAVDFWKPLRKSLGKKRKEISREDMRTITKLYANFKKDKNCKIFDNKEFMYKEYAVYQPLQRRAVISLETVEKLRTSTFFTSNSHIFNEYEYEQLLEMNPPSKPEEKKLEKYKAGKKYTEQIISALTENISDTVYMDYAQFEKELKKILKDIHSISASKITAIAMEISEMDKTAVIQKDKDDNIIIDKTTKDTEIIKLTKDVEEYFKEEVYPHVPDALYFDDDKLGAEFPFTRFFYEYKAPESADNLLAQFMEIEKSLSAKIAQL